MSTKSEKHIQVLICDDHAIVRQGLKQILAKAPDMEVCGETGSQKELFEVIKHTAVDVLMLDLNLPETDGWQILKQMQVERPDIPILILSIYPEDHYAVRCLKAGAAGYLNKSSAPQQLVDAIRKTSQGGVFVSPRISEKLAQDLRPRATELPHETLTEREFQVFSMIVEGKRLKEIAVELSLSIPTISTHKSKILRKMNMSNVVDLVQYALEQGLKL